MLAAVVLDKSQEYVYYFDMGLPPITYRIGQMQASQASVSAYNQLFQDLNLHFDEIVESLEVRRIEGRGKLLMGGVQVPYEAEIKFKDDFNQLKVCQQLKMYSGSTIKLYLDGPKTSNRQFYFDTAGIYVPLKFTLRSFPRINQELLNRQQQTRVAA